MRNRSHRNAPKGLSDLLNYAHFVDDGVLVNKDGAFVIGFKFSGPDLHSASPEEIDLLVNHFNRMLLFLEDGWMIHVDEIRIPSTNYPKNSAFPNRVCELIDEERREIYGLLKTHFENHQFMTFIWKFPTHNTRAMRHWFVEGSTRENDDQNDLSSLLVSFQEKIEQCIGLIRAYLTLDKLNSGELLNYLNTCITGEVLPISAPSDGCFIDVVLGRQRVQNGFDPKIGNKFIYILSLIGYLNEETVPGILEAMGSYSLIYRWSNRFIVLSHETAIAEMNRYQRNWNNKVKGFKGIVKEAVFGKSSNKINEAASQMSQQTKIAITNAHLETTRFGFWTSEVVLIHEDLEVLERASHDFSRYLEQAGFSCIREHINAMDAWLGTIPGHGSCNMRRIFINGINLAHLLPLHSTWVGSSNSSSHSLLPKQSPPVFYAQTSGKTPFRFHTDVDDVGHQVVLGPTGAGKSTYLGFLVSQFLRYQDAQIFIFDKDHSHHALTVALEGCHYDIGYDDQIGFCPLADLTSDPKIMRAQTYLEECVSLQQVTVTPEIRAAIYSALECLQHERLSQNKNMTVLRSQIQHELARHALQYYTLDGPIKILDASDDSMQKGYLHTFEMNWLLSQSETVYLPVLRHIFDQIENRLEDSNAKRPTLIILEEAWMFINHALFSSKLKDWLKTLRKKNARVVFATQSLSDLYDPGTKNLTSTTATILESCHTKLFLPNPSIESEIKTLYVKMGLSERQIQIISQLSVPKKHYYLVTRYGKRLIELGLNEKSLALAFIGLSKQDSQLLLEHKAKYKNEWPYYWLLKQGHSRWASVWLEKYNDQVTHGH